MNKPKDWSGIYDPSSEVSHISNLFPEDDYCLWKIGKILMYSFITSSVTSCSNFSKRGRPSQMARARKSSSAYLSLKLQASSRIEKAFVNGDTYYVCSLLCLSVSICLRETRSLCAFRRAFLSTRVVNVCQLDREIVKKKTKKKKNRNKYRNRKMEHVRFLQLAERTNSNAPRAFACPCRKSATDSWIVEMGRMRKIVST